jgi:hypothetical protein
MGAKDELELAREKVKDWYKAFPNAKVCIGNHDKRPANMAKGAKVSKEWVRGYAEVLDTKGWDFANEHVINGVLYTHGTTKKAKDVALYRGMSVVQGHFHTEFNVSYVKNGIWGMQVGCGIDKEAYSFNYAKDYIREQVLGCGVVMGRVPMLCPYVC